MSDIASRARDIQEVCKSAADSNRYDGVSQGLLMNVELLALLVAKLAEAFEKHVGEGMPEGKAEILDKMVRQVRMIIAGFVDVHDDDLPSDIADLKLTVTAYDACEATRIWHRGGDEYGKASQDTFEAWEKAMEEAGL